MEDPVSRAAMISKADLPMRLICGRCRSPQGITVAQLDDVIELAQQALPLQERLLASLENLRSVLVSGDAEEPSADHAEFAERTFSPESSLPSNPLTRQELRVLGLLCKGKTNREISRILIIAEKTAKNHVHSILRKLGVRSRTEAAFVWTNGQMSALERCRTDEGR
ncbi:helix-turn-helix domain-containing protein [Spirillospora sp. CA-253888]